MAQWVIRSDAAGGGDGSEASPWNTLAQAVAAQASFSPGDTVHVWGTLNEADLVFTRSGNAGNKITFQFHDGATVTGDGFPEAADVLRFQSDYLCVQGEADAYAQVKDYGVGGSGTGANIQFDSAEYCEARYIRASGSIFSGIAAGSCRGSVFEDLDCSDNAAKGFVCATQAGTDGSGQRDIEVRRITANRNGRFGLQIGGGNGLTTGGRNVISNCTARNNGTGIKLEDADDWLAVDITGEDSYLTGEGSETGNNLWMQNSQRAIVMLSRFARSSNASCSFTRSNAGLNKIDGLRFLGNYVENARGRVADWNISTQCADNWLIGSVFRALEGYTANEIVRLTRSSNSRVANCYVGGPAADGISLAFNVANADGWTVSNTLFDGLTDRALQGGAGITTFAMIANIFANMATNLVTVSGSTYTSSNITSLDAQAIVAAEMALRDGYIPALDSVAIGAGSRWWPAGSGRPLGLGGEPFPDTEIDIGAIQSFASRLHPIHI